MASKELRKQWQLVRYGLIATLAISQLIPWVTWAQVSQERLLSYADNATDSTRVAELVRQGSARYLAVSKASASQTFMAIDDLALEGPMRFRAWVIIDSTLGRTVWRRVRMRCDAESWVYLTSADGVYLRQLPRFRPDAAMRAACHILAVAAESTIDIDGRTLIARRTLDSLAFHAGAWRSVVGTSSLQLATKSRRATPDGWEAWVRYDNNAGGKTTALVSIRCSREQMRRLQGEGTDSSGFTRKLPQTLYERVAPDSDEEQVLLAVCGRLPLVQWKPIAYENEPMELIHEIEASAGTVFISELVSKTSPKWLERLIVDSRRMLRSGDDR